MAKGSINKILKSIGNAGLKTVDSAMNVVESSPKILDNILYGAEGTAKVGADIANGFNKKFMKDISAEELKNEWSPAKHLFKRKAKMSTNLVAFGGLTAFGVASGLEKEGAFYGGAKLGEVSAGGLEGMTDTFTSPTVDRMVDAQRRDPEEFSDAIQKNSEKYGSAGPDIVFALHQLRNR